MRKLVIPPLGKTETAFQVGSRDDAPVKMVCLALMLALVALGCRIAATW
jgi:hypothetical protein